MEVDFMKYGTAPNHIMKMGYDELIKSAKAKYSRININEFYVFCDLGVYSESSVNTFNDAIEHWEKKNGRWNRHELAD